MKNLLLFVMLFGCYHFSTAQLVDDNYIELTLTEDAPSHLPEGLKSLNNVKFGTLITDIDSLILTFGTYPEKELLMCFAHLKNEGSSGYVMSYLKPIDNSSFLSFEMDFEIIPYTKKISFRILNDESTNKFYYTWLNGNKTHKRMILLDVDNPIKLNESLPYFKVEKINKAEISSDELLGSWTVINWWATRCAPCIKEMPGLNKLVEKYQTNEKIRFVAISQDKRGKWEKFLKKKKFDYEQTLSNDATNTIFGDSYPKNIIVNPDGIVKYYSEGGYENKYLEIDEVLVKLTTK